MCKNGFQTVYLLKTDEIETQHLHEHLSDCKEKQNKKTCTVLLLLFLFVFFITIV